MLTLSHSGDAGDIILCGPLFRAAAEKNGELIDLVIYPNGGPPMGPTRTRQTEGSAESIIRLMLHQPYIGQARYAPHPEGNVLDVWRTTRSSSFNLAIRQLQPFNFSEEHIETAWIEPPARRREFQVIIHRSERYHNPAFPWREVLKKYEGRIGMVGWSDEHKAFGEEFWPIPFVEAESLADVAAVIAGSDLFIGNASAPHAIAEGMKHRLIQETCPEACWAVFPRQGARHVIDGHVELPELLEIGKKKAAAKSEAEAQLVG